MKNKSKRCFLWFKHKIVYVNGHGYRCKYCGLPKTKIKE